MITWILENTDTLSVLFGVPAALFVVWRFLVQRDLELRMPFRMVVLERSIGVAASVGKYLNAGDEDAYKTAWNEIAEFYSGVGQVVGDKKMYPAFAAFGEEIWELEWDEFENIDEARFNNIERLAREFIREINRNLNKHWQVKLSYVEPPLRRRPTASAGHA